MRMLTPKGSAKGSTAGSLFPENEEPLPKETMPKERRLSFSAEEEYKKTYLSNEVYERQQSIQQDLQNFPLLNAFKEIKKKGELGYLNMYHCFKSIERGTFDVSMEKQLKISKKGYQNPILYQMDQKSFIV
mmetsp:Transcript_35649/g.34681  ORF Transcript_35649/g.34681 Transcript_35649/m.34681 type:complete len:131 (+) Transcript_35649:722-1114(+)